jgi:effector-binding domain-containing protein
MYEIITVTAQPIAAVCRRVRWVELTAQIRDMFDTVYATVRARDDVRISGHNVILYRNEDREAGDIECGVQIAAPFADAEPLRCRMLPDGRAATAVHVGPYSGIKDASAAVSAWARQQGHPLAGVVWEIYGDWSDDPAQLRTEIFHLLRD